MAIRILKNLFSSRRGRKQSAMNPYFVWDVILGIIGVLFLALLIWNYNVFSSVRNNKLPSDSLNALSVIETIDYETLEDIINFYDGKKEHFDELKAKPPEFVDPSI